MYFGFFGILYAHIWQICAYKVRLTFIDNGLLQRTNPKGNSGMQNAEIRQTLQQNNARRWRRGITGQGPGTSINGSAFLLNNAPTGTQGRYLTKRPLKRALTFVAARRPTRPNPPQLTTRNRASLSARAKGHQHLQMKNISTNDHLEHGKYNKKNL